VITFTHWAVQSFPVGWGLRQFFCTFSLLVLQGFCRILPDFRGAEQPSLPLKVLMAKGFLFVQQALSSPKSGINCPGIFSLTLNTRHQPYSQLERTKGSMLNGQLMQGKNILSVSDFQWIGNRYRAASPQTQRWWKRLKYWVAHHALKITPPRVRWSYWAFPSAFCKLKSGMDYYSVSQIGEIQ
jgi:hypothetical protein